MKVWKSILVGSMVIAMTGTMSFAGKGMGRGGNMGQGPGISAPADGENGFSGRPGRGQHLPAVSIVEEGVQVTVSGTVAAVGDIRQGIQISTAEGEVTVYGFGPIAYWEELGVTFPAEGDEITVSAYEVTFSDGTVRIIAGSLTIGETVVPLRDEESGLPLRPRLGHRGQGGPGHLPPVNITEGEAVTISGTLAATAAPRQGVQIDTGAEVVTVYGFGPIWYWEQLEVTFPEVGTSVIVNAYEVTLEDGSVQTIAASVTVDGNEVALHDTETGLPLWWQERGAGPHHFPPADDSADTDSE